MKFIIDAQLPKSLADLFKSKGYDAIHTLDLPHANKSSDQEIISLASKEQRIVITKDNDFLESFLIYKNPSKLVIVSTGNIRNIELLKLFENNLEKICNSLQDCFLIEIRRDELIVHV